MSAPAFQFYPAEYLADENVAMMSLGEEGAYIRLMCYCWRQGSIPSDMTRLARLCKTTPENMEQIWPALEVCFRSTPGGRLVHPRLDTERRKQAAYREQQSESGKKGAEARWGRRSNNDAGSDGTATDSPMAKNGSSSLSSSSTDTNNGSSPDVDNSRGEFATIIRERWWQSSKAPIKDHTMTNDMSIRTQLLKQGWDATELNECLRLYNGAPATLRVLYKQGNRNILHELRGKHYKNQKTVVPKISDILGEMSA